jgi:hypothetical protein
VSHYALLGWIEIDVSDEHFCFGGKRTQRQPDTIGGANAPQQNKSHEALEMIAWERLPPEPTS